MVLLGDEQPVFPLEGFLLLRLAIGIEPKRRIATAVTIASTRAFFTSRPVMGTTTFLGGRCPAHARANRLIMAATVVQLG